MGLATAVSIVLMAPPGLAKMRYNSLDGNLTIQYENDCSTVSASGYYQVKGGSGGEITATTCSDLGGDGFVNKFVDTSGTYRCYGTMSHLWGQSVVTVWEIEGAVSGYSCLDIGESYRIEMDSGREI